MKAGKGRGLIRPPIAPSGSQYNSAIPHPPILSLFIWLLFVATFSFFSEVA